MGLVKGRKSQAKPRTSQTDGSPSRSKSKGREADLDLTGDNSDQGEGGAGGAGKGAGVEEEDEGETQVAELDNIIGYFEFKAIIDENKEEYLIDWEGVDPETNKPWPPSWEPKAGVDRVVVMEWKKAKKAKAAQKEVERVKALESRAQKGKSKEVAAIAEDPPARPNSRRESSTASSSTATLERRERRSSSRRDRDSAAPEPSSPTGESVVPPTQSAIATNSSTTSERRSSRRSNPNPTPSSPSQPTSQSKSKTPLPPSSLKKSTEKGKEKVIEQVGGTKKARFETTSSQAQEEESGNQTTSSNIVPDSQAQSQMQASSESGEAEGEDELESGMDNGEEQEQAQEGTPIPETPLSDDENGDDSDGAEEVGSHLLGGKSVVAGEPERPEEGSGIGSVSPALIFVQPDPNLVAHYLQEEEEDDEAEESELTDLSDSDGKILSRTNSPAVAPNATSNVGLAPKSSKPRFPVPTISPRRFETEVLEISTQDTIEDPDSSPQKGTTSNAPARQSSTVGSFDSQRRSTKRLELSLDPDYQRVNGNGATVKGKGKAPQVHEDSSSIDLTPLESSAGDLHAHNSMDQVHPQNPSQDPVEIGRTITGRNGAAVGGPFSRTAAEDQFDSHSEVDDANGLSSLSQEMLADSTPVASNGDTDILFESQPESERSENSMASQDPSSSAATEGQDDEDLGGYEGDFNFNDFVHADNAHESQIELSGDGTESSRGEVGTQDVEMAVDESETSPFRTAASSGDEVAPLLRKRVIVDETTDSDEEPAPKRARIDPEEALAAAAEQPTIRTPSPAVSALAAAATDVPLALASRVFLSPGAAQGQQNGSAPSPTMRSSSPAGSESQSRSRNASPSSSRVGKLIELINTATPLANEPETKEALVKFVEDPLAYTSGPMFDQPYWCFELKNVEENGIMKTQTIIIHPHEGVYNLRKAPAAKAVLWGFDQSITKPQARPPPGAVLPSIFAPPKNARETTTSTTSNGLPRSTSKPPPNGRVDRDIPASQPEPAASPKNRRDSPNRPSPPPVASTSGHPPKDFAVIISRVARDHTTLSDLSHADLERRCERLIELRRADKARLATFLAIAETPEALQTNIDTLTKANKGLSNKVALIEGESEFRLDLFREASAAALARSEEARVAEALVAQLQGQLDVGLKQRDAFYKGRIKGLEEAYARVSGQHKLLQEQTRRTNDTQTRQNASLWESHLAQLAKEQGPREDSSAGDTDWEDEMGDDEEVASQASSYVFVCEWRSQEDSQCGKMWANDSELKAHILEDHVPPMGMVS